MKTENLAIILTDIVGYTEATSRLSRKEQKEMLNLHNQLLFPIIRNFGGRVVKTIGDALLLVFRSPTDAMLCSMAMQDALYDFNRKSHSDQQLHIRIAASLGEVRVARNDVFGEAVNLTSRIESITPEDEIYLSEAIYLAMNKAEVPCVEVGLKELKGISEPVRIWQIPRFTRSRLVPEEMGDEDIGELSYPYGGAHLEVENKGGASIDLRASKRYLGIAALLVALVAAGVYAYTLPPGTFRALFASLSAAPDEQVLKQPAPAQAGTPPAVKQPAPVEKKPAAVAAPEKSVAKVAPRPAPPVVEKQTPTPPNPYAELQADLKSGDGAKMRSGARQIAADKAFVPELLVELQKGLQDNYQRKDLDGKLVDALSWYCKVLAQSGNADYLPVLEQVSAGAAHGKLKKYATNSLTALKKSVAQ